MNIWYLLVKLTERFGMMTAIRWGYSEKKGAASRISTGVVGFERKRPGRGLRSAVWLLRLFGLFEEAVDEAEATGRDNQDTGVGDERHE